MSDAHHGLAAKQTRTPDTAAGSIHTADDTAADAITHPWRDACELRIQVVVAVSPSRSRLPVVLAHVARTDRRRGRTRVFSPSRECPREAGKPRAHVFRNALESKFSSTRLTIVSAYAFIPEI
ncbi:hypothetical protein [Burkholderia gladioli]|uniref:hypothetical protein n=1 Tax=Burkholderia gladioli TaxID=28095 RepID=UPI0012F982C8|nr:hypothetical protein [Burkholderia gladioli]